MHLRGPRGGDANILLTTIAFSSCSHQCASSNFIVLYSFLCSFYDGVSAVLNAHWRQGRGRRGVTRRFAGSARPLTPLSGMWLGVDPRTDMEGRVLERGWITCSAYADHSTRTGQSGLQDTHDRLMSTRLFALIMNKVFI